MDSRRIVVSGRVQGVGFRYYILNIATNLELKGFVRNLPNGKVEIEAEGSSTSLDTLVDYCRIGPPRAVVSSVTTNSQPAVGYTGFTLR